MKQPFLGRETTAPCPTTKREVLKNPGPLTERLDEYDSGGRRDASHRARILHTPQGSC